MNPNLVDEAERLEESSQFAEAIERWRAVVAEAPAVENLARLGRVCALHGDSAEGERLLRHTILTYPDYGPAYFYLAVYLYEHAKVDEALPLLERSVAVHPWAPPLVLLGNVYDELDRHDDARRCFERAIALDSCDDEAWYGLGLIDRFTDVERALKSFSEAVRVNPDYGNAHRELGHAFWRRGDLDSAEEHVRTAIRLNEDDEWAQAYLGCILSAGGRIAEAETPFRSALAISPHSTLFHCYLGEALRKLDREGEAEQAFKTALSLDVSDYLANLRLGQLLLDRGQLDQAHFYIERARRSNPSSRAVRRALESLEHENLEDDSRDS